METNLPSPPFVDVDGIANFRDVGGVPIAAGQQGTFVQPGIFFRSADPTKVTETGLKTMQETLGIKYIFDLRSAPEIKREGPEWENVSVAGADVFAPYGIAREWTPAIAEKDYSPEQIAIRYKEYTRDGTQGFVKAYHDILEYAGTAYGRILGHLAQEEPSPCLIHCTAGKDRTGVVVALLLMLLGVAPVDIAEEYSLTDLGLAHLKDNFRVRLLKNPVLAGNAEGVQRMTSSKKENMEASIEKIERQFGGGEAYTRKYCGLDGAQINQLRKNFTCSKNA